MGRGGIVRDPALQLAALSRVASGAARLGYAVLDACASSITGARGNREFFLHLRKDGPPHTPDMEGLLRRALAS